MNGKAIYRCCLYLTVMAGRWNYRKNLPASAERRLKAGIRDVSLVSPMISQPIQDRYFPSGLHLRRTDWRDSDISLPDEILKPI